MRPLDSDASLEGRQRAVLDRVGRQLMQRDGNALRRTSAQHDVRPVKPNSRVAVLAIGRKLLSYQAAQVCGRPARLDKQLIRIRERLNPAPDCLLQAVGRIGLRKLHRRGDCGQDIPRPMLGLMGETLREFIGSLALGDVDHQVDRAKKIA